MNANDVLIDLLHDNIRRLQRCMATMSEDCLHWLPDPEANSIAVTVWHMGRLFDVFLTRQIIETLLQPGIGFDGQYTRYQLIQMALLDNVRHLGEILALKAMWERK